jgi:hypothetical protein
MCCEPVWENSIWCLRLVANKFHDLDTTWLEGVLEVVKFFLCLKNCYQSDNFLEWAIFKMNEALPNKSELKCAEITGEIKLTVWNWTYLFISRVFLHIWVFHKFIVLLAIRVLIKVLRPDDNDLVCERGEGTSLGPGATPSSFPLLIVAARWVWGLFGRRPNACHWDIKCPSLRAKSSSITLS